MDMPVNVPIDDPTADTEWNDILRAHGVIPEKPPSPTCQIEESLMRARELAHANRLEGRDLEELDELEDDEDEEFLTTYKMKRLAELSSLSRASVHGHVYRLQKPEYSRAVTEASKSYTVLVGMLGTNAESRLLSALWTRASARFADVKFCEIAAALCVEGYPEANTPTVLVYKDEDIVFQATTLRKLRGSGTRLEDIEGILVKVGAIQASDQRLRRAGEDEDGEESGIKSGTRVEDDDDDWD